MDRESGPPSSALLLFTKVPRPGLVKTRLIPPAGAPSPADIASLYASLLEDTLSAARDLQRAEGTSLIVSFTPDDGEQELRRLVALYFDVAAFLPQRGTTVTERVRNAFESAFDQGYKAVGLIPGDHADLDGNILTEAFRRLTVESPSVVLGPTSDGGAFLLGFNRLAYPRVSFDLEDTHLVCADIFRRAKASGIPCSFLENRDDIDDWEDAKHFLGKQGLSDRKTWQALTRLGAPSSAQTSGPGVSIIIPTLNEEGAIDNLLSSLERQTSGDFETIIVDGGSKDRTVDKAWGRADRIVFVGKPSRHGQETVGASDARGKVLLFLHADMTAPRNLVASVSKSLGDSAVIGGSCRVLFVGQGSKIAFLNAVKACGSRLLGIHGISSGFFVRRAAFEEAGGFREGVMEEAVDLRHRISPYGGFVTLDEACYTSARRFERGRFLPTLVVWVTTVLLTAIGLHFTAIERSLWKSAR